MIIVLSGMTCSGKTTLANLLSQQEGFERIVTTTTRPQRPFETDGEDYHFLSEVDFAKANLLERNTHGEHSYGVEIKALARFVDSATHGVLVIEPNGYEKVKKYLVANSAPHVAVFLNIDMPTLIARLMERLQTKDEMVERLSTVFEIESKWLGEKLGLYDMVLDTDKHQITEAALHINNHVNMYKSYKNSLSVKVS